MQPGNNIKTFTEATDPAGNNRLLLQFIELSLPERDADHKGYDFHALVWEVRAGDAWDKHVVVTRDDFARGSRRRWVSELHSFDSVAGTAIIKVGQEQPPAGDMVRVEYTWREWDLVDNRQVRVFRVCTDPFEAFEAMGRDE